MDDQEGEIDDIREEEESDDGVEMSEEEGDEGWQGGEPAPTPPPASPSPPPPPPPADPPQQPDPSPPPSPSQPASPQLSASPHEEAPGRGGSSWEAVLQTLGPDHPLLRGFQEAKRRQLREEKSQLQLRLMQLRQQTSDLKRENVTLGSKMFEVQQAVTRAQVNLDKSKTERRRTQEMVGAAREAMAAALRQEQEVVAAMTAARRHEVEMKREVERLGSRVAAVKEAREESDGDVTTLTRVLHKTAWDRAALEKDKMLQDMLVERLTGALEREQATLTTLDEAKREEAELARALKERARLQEEELLHLECEGVGVKRAWEANVVVLQRRSDEHARAQEHLQHLTAERAGLKAQLHNTRKDVRELQLEHEQQSCRLLRMERDVRKQREKLTATREEAQQLAERHEDLAAAVEQLETRSDAMKKEAQEQERLKERMYSEVRVATERWRRAEDQALARLAHHTAATRAARNLRRAAAEARARCRQLEDELVEKERGAADAALRASDARVSVSALTATKDSVASVVDQLNATLDGLERELKRGHEKVSTNESAVDRLNKQLAKVVELAQGSEAPPAEREERRLRLLLHDRARECAALEDEALTVHRHLLEAREARDILTEKISRLYQELSAMRSRQARLEGGVQQEQGALREAERRRERLHRALATVDARLHQESQLREAASREADAAETHLLAKLKVWAVTLLSRLPLCTVSSMLFSPQSRSSFSTVTLFSVIITVVCVSLHHLHSSLPYCSLQQCSHHCSRPQELEQEAARKGAELERMRNKKEEIEGTLLAATRERTEWEKSLAELRSIQETLRKDLGTEGDLHAMKTEITRMQKLSEIEAAVGSARTEKNRLSEEGQRQERLYAHNVRLLQEAATHLEQKLIKKQEEQLRLQECRARLRHLTAVRESRYKMLAAAGEEAQQAVRERLAARALAYSGVVAQLEAGYPQMEMKLRNMKALLQNFME
ncbi:coiled-coil domain-containing protein 40-like isoform X2 [Eriocheir sinensis]|uniref:coiled-coil domain-containing protein 40-like isoform X2 n=1 Tax=Eriocheir sinensis TaxID=95602 RepID=UPI0021C9F531|nr:coiled-coil domain-containing protein 40-like isoform X2 [Eriocheir sinensis]